MDLRVEVSEIGSAVEVRAAVTQQLTQARRAHPQAAALLAAFRDQCLARVDAASGDVMLTASLTVACDRLVYGERAITNTPEAPERWPADATAWTDDAQDDGQDEPQ